MGIRGRLIFPLLAEIVRIDIEGTRNFDPPGDPSSGYDEDFRAPTIADPDDDKKGEEQTQYLAPILVPCQVEPQDLEHLETTFSGNVPGGNILLMFHYKDLERLSLVDAGTGEPLIGISDRLVALRRKRTEALIYQFRDKGLYATRVMPFFGWLGKQRNLCGVNFENREEGSRRVT